MDSARISRMTIRAALLAAALAATVPSQAERMLQNTSTGRVTAGARVPCSDPGGFAHWASPSIDWFHNTSAQGAGKDTALQNAMASWTNVAGASHVLTYAGTTTSGFATDGINSVVWATGNGCTGNCLALTALVLDAGQLIIESDITFNNDVAWNTNGNDFDTEAVAAHEFGHTVGIHHTDVTAVPHPTMFTPYFGTDGRTLETDDRAALQCSQIVYYSRPAWLTVTPELCYGLNDVDWAPAVGATRYELYKSASSSFATQTLEYSGPSTTHTVNTVATRYFRVRACNALGCSAYRAGNRGTRYTNGCF
jgi:Matrixin